MARCLQVLFVALFAFALLHIGESLKCYDCVGNRGGECDNPSKNPNFIKTCSNESDAACYVRNTTLLLGGEVVRNCGRGSDCATPRGSDLNTTCRVCNEDLCNSSSYVMPSMLAVSIVAVICAKFYL